MDIVFGVQEYCSFDFDDYLHRACRQVRFGRHPIYDRFWLRPSRLPRLAPRVPESLHQHRARTRDDGDIRRVIRCVSFGCAAVLVLTSRAQSTGAFQVPDSAELRGCEGAYLPQVDSFPCDSCIRIRLDERKCSLWARRQVFNSIIRRYNPVPSIRPFQASPPSSVQVRYQEIGSSSESSYHRS